jgi:hypothetical protein
MSPPPRHPPVTAPDLDVNRIYESASELVEAASRLRAAAGHRHTWPAHSAVIACIETALGDLRATVVAMDPGPDGGDAAGDARQRSRVRRLRRGLETLAVGLDDAAVAAAAARALSARARYATASASPTKTLTPRTASSAR